MALAYLGYPAEKMAIAYDYVPREDFVYTDRYTLTGPDPERVYAGNPGETEELGFYCFPSALISGANEFLGEQQSQPQREAEFAEYKTNDYAAVDLTGTPTRELEEYLAAGVPLIVWTTTDGEAPRYMLELSWRMPNGKLHIPYGNLHVMLLTGYNETNYFFSDPLRGYVQISKSDFAARYRQMGSRAVALMPIFEEDFEENG
jgi:hypothetical protein